MPGSRVPVDQSGEIHVAVEAGKAERLGLRPADNHAGEPDGGDR
jgi:hypothetical protein